jgi:hypothetical protein
LINGKVYSDNRISWFDGFLKSRTKYPIVYGVAYSPFPFSYTELEKPDSSDETQIRRGERYGVLYWDDFPQGDDKLEPDIPTIYTNSRTWHKEERDERDRCHRLEALEQQRVLEDAVEEFEQSEVGQALKELNISFDNPALPDLLRSPVFLAIMWQHQDRKAEVEKPSPQSEVDKTTTISEVEVRRKKTKKRGCCIS